MPIKCAGAPHKPALYTFVMEGCFFGISADHPRVHGHTLSSFCAARSLPRPAYSVPMKHVGLSRKGHDTFAKLILKEVPELQHHAASIGLGFSKLLDRMGPVSWMGRSGALLCDAERTQVNVSVCALYTST